MSVRTWTVLTGTILAFVIAGCGGSGTKRTSSEKWVSVFCSAAATWERMMPVPSGTHLFVGVVDRLQRSEGHDLVSARSKLVGYIGDFLRKTRLFQKSLEAVAQPNVANGEVIVREMNAGFTQMINYLTRLKKQIKALPTTDPGMFWRRARELSRGVTTSADGVYLAAQGVRAGWPFLLGPSAALKLAQSADNNPDCQKLGGY
jgi:hypothetical protein